MNENDKLAKVTEEIEKEKEAQVHLDTKRYGSAFLKSESTRVADPAGLGCFGRIRILFSKYGCILVFFFL